MKHRVSGKVLSLQQSQHGTKLEGLKTLGCAINACNSVLGLELKLEG